MLVSVSGLHGFALHCIADNLQFLHLGSPLASKQSSTEVPPSAVRELSFSSNLPCLCQRDQEQLCWRPEAREVRGMHSHHCAEREVLVGGAELRLIHQLLPLDKFLSSAVPPQHPVCTFLVPS